MKNRDEFSQKVKDTLAKRVGYRCSKPECLKSTAGPQNHSAKSVNIGVAAHITAATKGGPRYDASLSAEERGSPENGIWLCQNCAKLIDNDTNRYSTSVLNYWKTQAEEAARARLEGKAANEIVSPNVTIDFDWKKLNDRSDGERHEYILEVGVSNLGPGVLKGHHLDLEFPTAVLTDSSGKVESRSDSKTSLFRKAWRNDDDNIYVDDRQVVLKISYFIDHQMYLDRGDLLDRVVRATFYRSDGSQVVEEIKFGEIQEY